VEKLRILGHPWSAFWGGCDEKWQRIEPHPDMRGVEQADDRRLISGIVQVLKSVGNIANVTIEQ
jgi:hypothetical protein